ncbi:zinc finger protein 292a [Brachyhypopomus gauderio]|uniref:zinc finger protein 292a n=1 Tax=Brachyhypopomus gauderio TaxID=698409 RepID=UPI0040435621
MAEEEAEQEYNTREETVALRKRFKDLTASLQQTTDSPLDASDSFCHEFCQILVEHGGQWKSEEDPLPLLEMYTVAILCFAEATPSLFPECEHVTVVLEKLTLSCLDFLLSVSETIPGALWEEFQSSVKGAHSILQATGNLQLSTLLTLSNESGVWTNNTLCSLLSNHMPDAEKVYELLAQEGPTLLDLRIKHLIKKRCVDKAAVLAKTCAEFPEFGGKKNFKQIYLVCLCETVSQQELMQEIKEIDCKDALDMICNLESEENEKGALSLCTAFLKRQLLQGDVYCAWELTLFWSKLLIRLESAQAFLDQCRLLAQLSGSVYHILLLIKVIQAEVQSEGLTLCIEMCIKALKIGVNGNEDCSTTICKTISCLLPLDLEVKRACQLTEFLVKPTVDSYYAVETLFNEPDQKLEEESLPIPNSLRCDLLLALKTQWPFDPEFWDWKTLKRHCLALMGEEASIVSSIDKLNDSEDNEGVLDADERDFKHMDFLLSPTNDLSDIEAERKKKRDMKKLREKGFVSARFRNWQAYMQYCVLCDKEFLGHRIVKHALKHVQDGIFRCPICAKSFETRAVLEPHVASHVKQSSKERLAAMNAKMKKTISTESILGNSKQDPSKAVVKMGQNVCSNYVGSSNTNSSTAGKVKSKISFPKRGNPVRDVENTEDCSCPVTSCQKVFKYFRNLVAHVKAHKNEEEATNFLEIQSQKAVCQYCRRQFVNVTHLNDHLQMHCGEKPYFCIQLGCKGSFHSHAELLMHRKMHSDFQAQCMFPNCGRVFSEAYLLYDHEAQHYITFTCKSNNCGRVFYSLSQLNTHQKEHTKQELSDSEGSVLQHETPTQSSSDLELTEHQADEVPKDFSPPIIKHSVESMLNSICDSVEEPEPSLSLMAEPSFAHDQSPARDSPVEQPYEESPTSEAACSASDVQPDVDGETPLCLAPCYVKLVPIPIKYDDPIFLNALRSSDSMTQSLLQDKKLFSFTWKQLRNAQITSNVHNGSVTKAGVQPCSQNNITEDEENLPHVCPFETCTRKYSTSKSLSRHVKNVHFEAFEEWKLARKYKRIAEIAARKSLSEIKDSSFQTPKKKIKSSDTATSQQYTEIQEKKVSADSTLTDPVPPLPSPAQSFSAKFCPQFENSQSEIPLTQNSLVQPQLSQSWSSPSFDGYNSDYSLQNHFPTMIMPDSLQAYPLYLSHTDLLSEKDMDYTPSLTDDGNTQSTINTDSHSSVMNEASKYVSSSLRVLHSLNVDQACEMPQAASSEELGFMEIRQNDDNVGIPPDVGDLHSASGQNFNQYFSPYPVQTCSSAVQTIEKANKEFTVNQADPLFSSPDVKCLTHFASPICKEEPESFSVSSVGTATMENEQSHDLSVPEASQVTTENVSPENKNITNPGEIKKEKKIRSSRRTKWPAIIKDGKVICCRCYREFSSTKSLGGHLSKRSQCRPIDEVDLTADLPTSFLDFLNDPDISTIQTSLPRNNPLGQDTNMLMHQQSESDVLNTFTEIHGSNYSVQNGSSPSGDTSEITFVTPHNESGSSSSRPPLSKLTADVPVGPETDNEKNTEIPSTSPGEDGKILEIERAFERLDLVDLKTQETLKVVTTTLHNHPPEAETAKCVESQIEGQSNDLKNILKPFRCVEEGCVYGAMTKEALFKHLCRVHDFGEDKINELKKNPDKLSPYNCNLCTKTFTRTTGLKIHYKNVHHFSIEEMSKLKIGKEFKKTEKSNSESKNVRNSIGHSQRGSILSVQPQCTSSPIVKMVNTNSRKEPADIPGAKQFPKQEPLEGRESCALANETQKISSLNIKSEKDLKPLTSPCHTTNKTSVQCTSADAKPKQAAGNSLPPGKHCNLDKVASTASTHVGETAVEKKDKPKKTKAKVESIKKEKAHKPVGGKGESSDMNDELSLYRPYRCVHEGCVAAFSIQQNLILHYRAMHQSERSAETSGGKNINGGQAEGAVKVHEFKCQVKECSKVVSKVTSLLKHYLLLHRCTLEKASALLTGVEVGTFQCDQSKCPAYFTCHLKYIEHIKNDHKSIRVSADGDFESVDLTFKCECEGCDRVYTTKSNLLRHLMKKHEATFETIKQKQKNCDGENVPAKATSADPNNGKENIASNKVKLKKKISKKKDEKVCNHWTSFGKPSLKSMDEASAVCTGRFPLQYPCMIKGCESVLNTERRVFKHYTTHGLTERYIEDQRSHFIFCKKNTRLKNKDVNKLDDSSGDTSEVEKTDPEESNAESSLVWSQLHEPENTTPPERQSDEDPPSILMPDAKRKPGRPRKSEQTIKINPEKKSVKNGAVDGDCVTKVSESTSDSTDHQEEQTESGVAQKLFSPLGFEESILKLFEESSSTNTFKRKTSESEWTDMPLKRQQTIEQNATIIYKDAEFQEVDEDENVVHFRNPLKLESVNNVKIVMDESFSNGADLLLKQLQDMRPMVILKKWLCS